MTVPGYPPAPPPRTRRRWWPTALVVTWALVLAGFAVWSVRNDPPTVPEQRDIAEALPILQRATGQVLAAADAADRTVTLGELTFDRDCALTPVWEGVEATREVTVRVQAGRLPGALQSISRALPGEWAPAVRSNSADTRYGLRADAGNFVGIDTTADVDATVFTLLVSTGCRPLADGITYDPEPGVATDLPAPFTTALRILGTPAAEARSVEVACPAGDRVARTVTVEGTEPADLAQRVQSLLAGAVVVQAGAESWAYRAGSVSMVVSGGEGSASISATTACR